MDCAFCSTETLASRIIAETDLVIAFPTNIPIVPGHTLIVPKRHAARYEDLTGDEREEVEQMRMRIVGALKKSFGAEGFNYAWNEEKVAGQSVPHFHLHVVPRTEGDTGIHGYEPREFLYRPKEPRAESPEVELADVAKRVREAL